MTIPNHWINRTWWHQGRSLQVGHVGSAHIAGVNLTPAASDSDTVFDVPDCVKGVASRSSFEIEAPGSAVAWDVVRLGPHREG